MANMNFPDVPPDPKRNPLPRLAQTMAYGSGTLAPNGHIISQLHRLRRGFPYMRGGLPVPPVPQFKGLNLYTQATQLPTAVNPALRAPLQPAFRQTLTSTRVRRTVQSVPNVVTP
jgi:hypothetical protein